MSKLGRRPIIIPDGVTVEATASKVIAVCNDKKLEIDLPREVSVKIDDGKVIVDRKGNDKNAKSLHGLIARLIKNIIVGVKDGFTRTLEFTGTGYRASIDNNELLLNMGYSHEIKLPIPEKLTAKVIKNSIIISGLEKDRVGQFAAIIRDVRPPEVYKGKGIRYSDEFIKRKAGKTAASK